MKQVESIYFLYIILVVYYFLQYDFNGSGYHVGIYVGNVLVVCGCYGLLQSRQFAILKDETLLSCFGLKTPRFMFSEDDFSALNLLNH